MQHQVSPAFIAMRRGGPRRAALMLASVFALFAVQFVWLRGSQGGGESLIPLLLTGALMCGVGYFQITRMAKATASLASFQVEVAPTALVVESSAGKHELKLSEIQRVLLFRSVFSEAVAYVGLETGGRVVVVPPLRDNAAFVRELQGVAPHAPQVGKRKLLLFVGM